MFFAIFLCFGSVVGFLVKATSLSGEILNGTLVRFAQRKEHHDTKQPILVLFTDDGLQKHRNFISPSDEGSNASLH